MVNHLLPLHVTIAKVAFVLGATLGKQVHDSRSHKVPSECEHNAFFDRDVMVIVKMFPGSLSADVGAAQGAGNARNWHIDQGQ